VAQRDTGAAEAGAGELGAVHRRMLLQQRHELVELGDRHFVVVAQARVRCVHQLAEQPGVVAFDRTQHARVLGDDVARAPTPRVGQCLDLLRPAHVAQARDAEPRARFLAFAAPLVERARDERARNAGIEDEHRGPVGQRPQPGRERASVEEERVLGVGEARRHLVHDPAANAGVLDLGTLGHLRDPHVVGRQREQCAQGAQRRHLERRARRQADAHRQLRGDVDVERGHVVPCVDHFAHATEDVAPERLVGEGVDRVGERPGEAGGAQRELASGRARERHGRLLRQRDRQHEAVVVVGVLAEEVDSSGRFRGDLGAAAERRDESFAQDRGTSMACSSRALSSGNASIA
jgi:hypothetical protein